MQNVRKLPNRERLPVDTALHVVLPTMDAPAAPWLQNRVGLIKEMSTSEKPAVLCTICDSTGVSLCAQCRSVRYCSKKCQRIDWPTHKLLCRSFSDFRVRPGPTFRRGILFPVREETPKFIWLEINSPTPHLRGLLGPGEPIGSWLYCQENTYRNRKLENTLVVAHRDNFLNDGSLPNQSTSKVTRGEHAHKWAGPMVAFRIDGLDFLHSYAYGDMTLDDFRHTVDFFMSYDNDYYANDSLTGVAKVKGVRISCNADKAMFGADKYIPVDVEDCHEVFRMKEPIGISKLIELPIFVRNCPPHQVWKNGSTANYTNISASWLHLDLDPTSAHFGWIPFRWNERVGSVLAARVDRKALYPHHMEALCDFCQFTLQPLIEDSFGAGLVERTRDDVMQEMTKAKFKEFFRDYKAKQRDPAWMATPCPYDI